LGTDARLEIAGTILIKTWELLLPSAVLRKPSRVDRPPPLSTVLESAVYDMEIVGDQRWVAGIIGKEPGVYRATLWKMRP
jgi:hypothetical protein